MAIACHIITIPYVQGLYNHTIPCITIQSTAHFTAWQFVTELSILNTRIFVRLSCFSSCTAQTTPSPGNKVCWRANFFFYIYIYIYFLVFVRAGAKSKPSQRALPSSTIQDSAIQFSLVLCSWLAGQDGDLPHLPLDKPQSCDNIRMAGWYWQYQKYQV